MSENTFADLIRTMGQFNCTLLHTHLNGGSWAFLYAPTPTLNVRALAIGKNVEEVVQQGIENAKLAQATYNRDLIFDAEDLRGS